MSRITQNLLMDFKITHQEWGGGNGTAGGGVI